MAKKKTFSIISLGCFRNTYDSEIIAARLKAQGYQLEAEADNLDLLLINTCGFIRDAKQEAVDVLKDAVALKEEGRIKKLAVVGCLVQRYQDELKRHFPQVDIWQGIEPLSPLALPRQKIMPAWLDFLKIAEGCSHCCSYCAIPMIKGPLFSKPVNAILEEVKRLDDSGVKELNIIGQDITAWGQDRYKKKNLAFLLKKIAANCSSIRWIRLLYTHPDNFSDELIDVIASQPNICKYIDLPVQHINDRILKLMNRRISKKEILKLIEKLRARIPGCVIRTSLIAGFPTETEAEFRELLDFLSLVKFDKAGAFAYSREEGTAAAGLKPQVHHRTIASRLKRLMALQQDISLEANSRFVGQDLEVLAEEKEDDVYICRNAYNCYDVDGVVYVKRKKMKPGEFYKVKITDALEYDLVGK